MVFDNLGNFDHDFTVLPHWEWRIVGVTMPLYGPTSQVSESFQFPQNFSNSKHTQNYEKIHNV